MALKIHKDFLDKVESYTKFGSGGNYRKAVRYVFNLPQGSEYENYALTVDTDDYRYSDGELVAESVGAGYERKGSYYVLNVDEKQKFLLTRYKEREEGKRYKRYELSVAELNAVFNCGKDVTQLPLVVANVKQYLNNGRREAGTVISSKITVAHSDGTWLYVDDERRRINSNGVDVIGELPAENKEKAESEIRLFYLTKDAIERKNSLIRSDIGAIESIYRSANLLGGGLKDTAEEIQKICVGKKRELREQIKQNEEWLPNEENALLLKLKSFCK